LQKCLTTTITLKLCTIAVAVELIKCLPWLFVDANRQKILMRAKRAKVMTETLLINELT
jgi:hypothetical protein